MHTPSDRESNALASSRSDRLKQLILANRSLACMESLDELLNELLDLAQEVTDAEASSILLYDGQTRELQFMLAKNVVLGRRVQDMLQQNIRLKLGEGIAGWVAKTRQSLLVEDAQADGRFMDGADRSTGFTTHSLICVPVVHYDELLGVIQVLNPRGKKRFDQQDEEILSCFANLAAVAMVRSRLLQERLERERLQTQLEAASRIQSQFWPRLPELPGSSRVWAATAPAAFVGGDLYDVIAVDQQSYLVYVADVSGKGLPASLVMAALWSSIRSEADRHEDVAGVLAAVNKESFSFLAREGGFATAFMARYWPLSGRLRFCCAGHPEPLLATPSGRRPLPSTSGLPLGILSDSAYESAELTIEEGESLLVVTDGVTEARNETGEFFGERRLQEIVGLGVRPLAQELLKRLSAWRGRAPQNDDTTLMEIWREERN